MILKTKLLKSAIAVLGALAIAPAAHCQQFAVKTNLLSDALLNVNAGVEMRLSPKVTLDITGDINDWTLNNGTRWKHWVVMPETRYWLCEAFAGHFFALDVFGGQYNMGGIQHMPDFLGNNLSSLSKYRYQGWMAGAGLAYGYSWVLNKHINIEAEIGLGWAYSRYDKYPCTTCGTKLESNRTHNYVGPTKAAVNFVYVF